MEIQIKHRQCSKGKAAPHSSNKTGIAGNKGLSVFDLICGRRLGMLEVASICLTVVSEALCQGATGQMACEENQGREDRGR